MSVLHSSRTPRTSASHGRIVTQNSTLSAALRENSDVVAVSSAPSVSVHSSALDVVSSSAIISNASTNPTTTTANSNSDVEYVAVSKSRTSLNSDINSNRDIQPASEREKTPIESDIHANTNESAESDNNQEVKESDLNVTSANVNIETAEGSQSTRYSYKPLKSRESSQIPKQVSYVKDNGTFYASGDGIVHNVNDKNNFGLGQVSGETEVNETSDTNTRSYVNSRLKNQSRTEQHYQPEEEPSVSPDQAENTAQLHEHSFTQEHSLIAPQHTRLSLNSQHDRVSRDRVPFALEESDKAVPPLDLHNISRDHSPDSQVSDSPQTSQRSGLFVDNQNLHASDLKTPLTHFSQHDIYDTGRRTYEVESPVLSNSLPHIKSSATNFRQEGAAAQGEEQDTFREQEPDRVEPNRSDLADDLNIPIQFDTQAQAGNHTDSIKPPSPPVQTTPPPSKEPATSLRSSQVYAVANPEIQRAQGTASRKDNQEVKFDPAAQQPPGGDRTESRVKDRAPTPYARSPQREELIQTPPDWDSPRESQEKQGSAASRSSRQGLPPQHPPIDTLATPKSGTRRLKNEDTQSIKRVYVESPSFTREEEEEYRFVSSRLDDIEDKTQTFRAMDNSRRGYGGDDNYGDVRTRNRDSEYDRRGQDRDRSEYDRRDKSEYDRRPGDRDRYENTRVNDRYDDRDRRNDRYDDRDKRGDRYDDRNRPRDLDRGRVRTIDKEPERDRYEDRTHEMNGYSDYSNRDRQRGRDERDSRYDEGSKHRTGDERYEKYERLRDERDGYNREMRREDDPNIRGYQKQNSEMDEQELQKEAEYQKDLKKRIEKNMKMKDERDKYGRGNNYDKENDYPRDSLEYPDERDRGFARDSLEYNNYDQQQDWDNPPPNPYQDDPYYQQSLMKQDSKPDFYDPDDAEKMEIVNPKAPRYDYVEKNKQDYGLQQRKTYRDIVHRKKEEEEKLDHVFITPKVPSKPKKKAQQKAQSAQPQHMGYQPPPQYPVGFKPSSAEEIWEKRAQLLSVKKESAQSSKPGKGSASKKVPRWNSNPQVKHAYKYEAPPALPNAGQPYKAPNAYQPDSREQGSYSQTHGGYGTPTRQLQPLENRPAPPVSTEYVPTAVNPASPFRRHMELKPITQEITTEDGQRISVDINLRLISPPPGQSGPVSPTQQHQLALIPMQENQQPLDGRGIGVPYQMQDMYGNYDNGYGYAEVSLNTFLINKN